MRLNNKVYCEQYQVFTEKNHLDALIMQLQLEPQFFSSSVGASSPSHTPSSASHSYGQAHMLLIKVMTITVFAEGVSTEL